MFEIGGWRLSLQVTTFENTYGLDAERTVVRRDGDGWVVDAEGLTWAGGQMKADGRAWLRASPTEEGIEVVAGAEVPEGKVRSVKVIVRGLEAEQLIGRNWEARPFPRARAGAALPGVPGHAAVHPHTARVPGEGRRTHVPPVAGRPCAGQAVRRLLARIRGNRRAYLRGGGARDVRADRDAAVAHRADARPGGRRAGAHGTRRAGVRAGTVGRARGRAGLGAGNLAGGDAARDALDGVHVQHVRADAGGAGLGLRADRGQACAGVHAGLGGPLLLAVRGLPARAADSAGRRASGRWRTARDGWA